MLRPAQVRLRSAVGDDMRVFGSIVVRGKCKEQPVELTALVASRATMSLCSATQLLSAGCGIDSRLRHGPSCSTYVVVAFFFGGMADETTLREIQVAGTREINAITPSTVKRDVGSLKSEM